MQSPVFTAALGGEIGRADVRERAFERFGLAGGRYYRAIGRASAAAESAAIEVTCFIDPNGRVSTVSDAVRACRTCVTIIEHCTGQSRCFYSLERAMRFK